MKTRCEAGEAAPSAGGLEDGATVGESPAQRAGIASVSAPERGEPRLLRPERSRIEWRASSLESLLGPEHRARLVWAYVERQDLAVLLDAVKARGTVAGRPAIDPHILLALWLYAKLDGVGSGREITRLVRAHDAYRWICGGVSIHYHAVIDFRVGHGALLDGLLTDNVAALAAVGAISLERVAQDGMRVRAAAGAASFRREGRLQEHLAAAGELVDTLKAQVAADPGGPTRRARAARLRAAREREECLREALAQLPDVAAARQRQGAKPEDARASSTDAQARVMKMGDGGFRPAYNVQLSTVCGQQVIVGMDVVTTGSDLGQLAPMVGQVTRRLGETPGQWLVDGGFPAHAQIDAVASRTEVYAPVPKPKPLKSKDSTDPAATALPPAPRISEFERKPGDSEAVAQWRQRMNTPEARQIYKHRAATAECVNALARNRGLLRLPVRGLAKVKCVVALFVLAHNLMRTAQLAPELLGWGTGASAAAAMAA